jgi:GNAT superfamily N-acetyltransferase
MRGVRIECVRGRGLAPWLDAVARLRIAVFREFPYLYDGDAEYEARYLRRYADIPDSVCVLAIDEDRVVGASTGMPLEDEDAPFRRPFSDRGIAACEVFYLAESVLLPAYRGQGFGHRFFDGREAHARALGRFRWTAFAAVDRAPDDPRRPPGARDHDMFWAARGYVRQPGMTMHLPWREFGEAQESAKPLTFWLRPLEQE